MNKQKSLISVRNGELIYDGLNHHLRKKYSADTPLDRGNVPYIVMALCAAVDLVVFYNLFSAISYDSPLLLAVQIAGFLFGFDVVPVFMGIELKRIRQGISKDRFILWLALTVCAIAVALNVLLRLLTIDELSADTISTSYIATAQQAAQSSSIDATAIALTVFGIFIPLVTSLGSFFVSYVTYHPLRIRRARLEAMIGEKEDEIRRLSAMLVEYDTDENFDKHLMGDDEDRFDSTKKLHRALIASYCDYVRQRLKEHLANPTATNALSEETCVGILQRLDRELAALEPSDVPNYSSSSAKTKTMVSNDAAA
jgi:hypothetical protein